MLKTYFTVAMYAIIVENIVLVRFLGVCPLLGVTDSKAKTFSMSLAVIFTMTFSSALCWLANRFILVPFGLEYLQTLTFIFIIAFFVQFIELFMKKNLPQLHKALGVYVPLITTNCAIFGCIILGIQKQYDFLLSTFYGFASGVSFMLALLLFSAIRQRIELADDIPECFKGEPILLIAASLLAMIFNGFSVIAV